MAKKFLTVVFSAFCAMSFSQEIEEKDTITHDFEAMEFEAETPDSTENCGYPANEIYGIWDTRWVNPYKIKIDSLPDSVSFNCADYVHPLESSRITSNFGVRRYRFHYGIDIGLTVGDTIRAAFDGQVRIVEFERRGYGHYVVLRHPNGLETIYAHMLRPLRKVNDLVKAGEPIGLGGNTGRSTGPHLHFEVRFLGNAINPIKLIDFSEKTIISPDYLMVKSEAYDHKPILDELAKALWHKVRSGDTLSGIAKRYGTNVGKICRLNGISARSILRIGQKVRVR